MLKIIGKKQMSSYFVLVNGEKEGPYTLEQIKYGKLGFRIEQKTKIFSTEIREWKTLSEIEDLKKIPENDLVDMERKTKHEIDPVDLIMPSNKKKLDSEIVVSQSVTEVKKVPSEKKQGVFKLVCLWLKAGFYYAVVWSVLGAALMTTLITNNTLSFDLVYLIVFLGFPLLSSLVSFIMALGAYSKDYWLWMKTLPYTLVFASPLHYVFTTSSYLELREVIVSKPYFTFYCVGCFFVLNIILPIFLKSGKKIKNENDH